MDNTINGRTPDEIKRGLECRKRGYSEKCNRICSQCAFYVPNLSIATLYANALALIQQLERERDEARKIADGLNAQSEGMVGVLESMKRKYDKSCKERDAAIKDLNEATPCFSCLNFKRNGGKCDGANECKRKMLMALMAQEEYHGVYYEWRGVQEVE